MALQNNGLSYFNKIKKYKMAEYRISGIWKDNEGVITHYAIHSRTGSQLYGFSIGKGIKTTKADAVTLIAQPFNTAKTYL
ncbi:hypothetical protein [Flavobacterium sp. SM2513]|uniref:hypothetical protein n=1 Tax=Flavobacterium sp. SM2513 TaxID=3424766 RepID=UPI003D7F72E6